MIVEHKLLPSCREMTEADLDQVLAIEAKCHLSPWSAASFRASIHSAHACWVLEHQQQILAYAITSTVLGEAELLNITVEPSRQQQGIASAFLLSLCNSFGESIETLFLEVRASNSAAIALYQSLDFNEVGRRANYYPAKKGREDALIMAKMLTPTFK